MTNYNVSFSKFLFLWKLELDFWRFSIAFEDGICFNGILILGVWKFIVSWFRWYNIYKENEFCIKIASSKLQQWVYQTMWNKTGISQSMSMSIHNLHLWMVYWNENETHGMSRRWNKILFYHNKYIHFIQSEIFIHIIILSWMTRHIF